jgi:hypothetical protein
MCENKIISDFNKLDMEENVISSDIIISDIDKKNVKTNIINKGNNILKNNVFFYDLEKIMSDNNFRTFYDKYFKDFNDIKVITLYMKLYETIQLEYKERNNCDIEKELLAYMIKQLMDDKNSRKLIFEAFNDYTENNNPKNKKFILDIFNNNNKNKDNKFTLIKND